MKRFDKHIFISYAHIDNQPLTRDQEGWISRFHTTLDTFLSQRLGANALIWRDEKLRGNDIFSKEIVEQFHDSALMVSVLTPRYINSEWCRREINEFCSYAEQVGDGIVVNNKSRILKVIKTPIDTEDALPDLIREMLGYEFYLIDEDAPMELDPEYGDKFKQEYLRKVCILANDAARLIKTIKKLNDSQPSATEAADQSEPVSDPRLKTVYLAECSYELRSERELLEADLKLHGYTVLPEQRLPAQDEAEFCSAVAPLLDRCGLAVHLIGSNYGGVPDGPSHKSIVVLQNEMAVKRSKDRALKRLIWLPAETKSEQPQQQVFIDALQSDATVQFGADLISDGMEELKATVHKTLKELQRPATKAKVKRTKTRSTAETSTERLIYLNCVDKDRKATVPLRKWLKAQGLDVRMPAFEGDAEAVRQANQDLLRDCDGVLIFYGAGDEAWNRSISTDLKKAGAYRDGTPLELCFTYLSAPKTADKEDMVDMEEDDLIDGLEGFDAEAMAPFMEALGALERES